MKKKKCAIVHIDHNALKVIRQYIVNSSLQRRQNACSPKYTQSPAFPNILDVISIRACSGEELSVCVA